MEYLIIWLVLVVVIFCGPVGGSGRPIRNKLPPKNYKRPPPPSNPPCGKN